MLQLMEEIKTDHPDANVIYINMEYAEAVYKRKVDKCAVRLKPFRLHG